jgi:hypothetical protein
MLNKILKLTKIAATTALLVASANVFADAANSGAAAGGAARAAAAAAAKKAVAAGEAAASALQAIKKNTDNLVTALTLDSPAANAIYASSQQALDAQELARQASSADTVNSVTLPAVIAAEAPATSASGGSVYDELKPVKSIQDAVNGFNTSSSNASTQEELGVKELVKTVPTGNILAAKPSSGDNKTDLAKAILLNFDSYLANGAVNNASNPQDLQRTYIQLLTGASNAQSAQMDLSGQKLSQKEIEEIQDSSQYQTLLLQAYGITARKSVGASGINYVIASQKSDGAIASATANLAKGTDSTGKNINFAKKTPIQLAKLTQSTLGMIAYELTQLHQDNLRLIASASISNIQQGSLGEASMGSQKAKVGQLISKIKQQDSKNK